jgi:hypothetical protein
MTKEEQQRIAELEEEKDTDRFVDIFAREYAEGLVAQDKEYMNSLKQVLHRRVGEAVRELAHEYLNERRLVN